jgi:hypothetical protein
LILLGFRNRLRFMRQSCERRHTLSSGSGDRGPHRHPSSLFAIACTIERALPGCADAATDEERTRRLRVIQ